MAASSRMQFLPDNYSTSCSYFQLEGSFNSPKPLAAGSNDLVVNPQTSSSSSRRWASEQGAAVNERISKYGYGFAQFSCLGHFAHSSGGSAAVAQGADNFGGGSGGGVGEEDDAAARTRIKRGESRLAGSTAETNTARNSLRTCKLCGTSKTPLWRSGPQGPKALCNACGIRFKKSKRAAAAAALGDCGGLDSLNVAGSPSSSTSKKMRKGSAHHGGDPGEDVAKQRGQHRYHQPPLTWAPNAYDHRTILPPDCASPNSHAASPAGAGRQKDLPALMHVPHRRMSTATSLHIAKKRNRPAEDLALRRCKPSPETSTATSTSSTPLLAKDELEQAAFLLMALSCGLVLA